MPWFHLCSRYILLQVFTAFCDIIQLVAWWPLIEFAPLLSWPSWTQQASALLLIPPFMYNVPLFFILQSIYYILHFCSVCVYTCRSKSSSLGCWKRLCWCHEFPFKFRRLWHQLAGDESKFSFGIFLHFINNIFHELHQKE